MDRVGAPSEGQREILCEILQEMGIAPRDLDSRENVTGLLLALIPHRGDSGYSAATAILRRLQSTAVRP